MLAVLIVGLAMNAVVLPLAGRRVLFLFRLISSGQPAPDRLEGVTSRLGAALKRQVVEVFGQKKLLKWSVPGAAHFFVFWAFVILATVYLEAYGSLLKVLFTGGKGPLDWAIPFVGHWAVLGFAQDFIAMMAFFAIVTFVWIRMKNAPKDLGRRSRFFGSHLSGAWITLFMIFNVIWTMFLFRGASAGLGNLPYKHGAFVSIGVGKLLDGIPQTPLEVIEGIGLLLHIGVMLVFLIFVLHSKHLHIFVAPLNVLFGRSPVALGAVKPMMSGGRPITLDDFEDLDEEAKLGVGAAEDFSWKGILDFETCTECGRCQDQCPAWNTEKPLSPKLLIMALRDHTLAKAPYLLADEGKREGLLEGNDTLTREVERPMVGDTGEDWFYMPDSGASVIDPDVLWSCVTCGACVQQCPVDIEHVDHIIDMRRYQVLVESNFPTELNGLFKGLENKGNPWNMSATARLDWAKDLPFDVKVVGEDVESLDEVDWLFWVGCAGAYEDRAKKTTRAVAELLDMAGVSFAVLGNGETCNGDPARRAGNEFVFQGLAAQNVETFKEHKVKKVVSTCAHCFNTLKNEYKDFGIELEVVHHTQLLNQLVRDKRLVPVAAQGASRSVTYHDPCYLGRHNQVYSPPRELLEVIPNADFVEMPRNSERSFCCGAGGARMWMEETIGTRINTTRTKEAVGTGADQIAVGCPFCRVMLSDGLTEVQSKGEAREEVEVLDVAQMLLASIKGEAPKKVREQAPEKPAEKVAGTSNEPASSTDESIKDEPEEGDATQSDDTVTATEEVGPAAKASGGSSLFDLGSDSESDEPSADATDSTDTTGRAEDDIDTDVEPETTKDTSAEKPASSVPESGSLFDIEAPSDESGEVEPEPEPVPEKEPSDQGDDKPRASTTTTATPASSVPESGSLFDIEAPAEEADGSTTDQETDRAQDDADTDVEPDPHGQADTTASGTEPQASASVADLPGTSMFDLEARTSDGATEDTTTSAAEETVTVAEDPAGDSTTDDDTDRVTDDADTSAASEGGSTDAPEDKPAIRSLRDIKAQYADGDAEPRGATDSGAAEKTPADPEPSEETTPEGQDESDETGATSDDGESEPTKPATSSAAHKPKTDADIGEAGSLFDL